MELSSPFLVKIKDSVLVADGGMGTLLHEKGISFNTNFDNLCLIDPELVVGIHRDYIDAGADCIETNSFGANPIRLRGFGLEKKAAEINRAAARLARQARDEMGRDVFIAGSIGPTGRGGLHVKHPDLDKIYSAFCVQVEGLLEGGVDLFLLETFSDLTEIKRAIAAVRSLSRLPLVAQMTFTYESHTHLGESAERVAEILGDYEVDIIGANCSVGPQPLLDVIAQMTRGTDKPLSAMPNAGLPRYIDGRYLYYTSPDYFNACAAEFVGYGVRLIGGCCGTTPDHIRKLGEAVRRGIVSEKKAPYQPLYVAPVIEESPQNSQPAKNRFREKLGKEFVISVEIDPPRGSNPRKILSGANYLNSLGIDAINVADSPMGRSRMAAVAAAALIQQSAGIEGILHLTCRDLNLMGLQSSILGAYALGIHNILSITGDPPSGDYPNVTAVYDVDSIGLLEIIDSLNNGYGVTGAKIGYPTDILSGAALDPAAENEKLEMERLKKKLDSGAVYFMTQPVFDIDTLKRFLDKTAAMDLTILLGVLPLQSLRHAIFLANEVPGISIPNEIIKRIERAGKQAHEAGVEIAAEISEQCRDLVAGIYYMPSFGRYETIGAVLKQIGLTGV